jgi:flavin reductase (DIM6/NTAB) family NADH-FMN oxidoreductase RutF
VCIYIQRAAAVNAAAADAVGVMELKVVSDFIPAGDHEVVVCDVVNWKHMQQEAGGDAAAAGSTPLYSGYLRDNGFL